MPRAIQMRRSGANIGERTRFIFVWFQIIQYDGGVELLQQFRIKMASDTSALLTTTVRYLF